MSDGGRQEPISTMVQPSRSAGGGDRGRGGGAAGGRQYVPRQSDRRRSVGNSDRSGAWLSHLFRLGRQHTRRASGWRHRTPAAA